MFDLRTLGATFEEEASSISEVLTSLNKVTEKGAKKVGTLIFDSHGNYSKAYFKVGGTYVYNGTGANLAKIGTYLAEDGAVVLLACHSGGNGINGGEKMLKTLSKTMNTTVYGSKSWTGAVCLFGCNTNPSEMNPDHFDDKKQPLAWKYLGQWNKAIKGEEVTTLSSGITLSSSGGVSENVWTIVPQTSRGIRKGYQWYKKAREWAEENL